MRGSLKIYLAYSYQLLWLKYIHSSSGNFNIDKLDVIIIDKRISDLLFLHSTGNKMFKMQIPKYVPEVLPRTKALMEIWKEDNYFTARSMDVYITKLRKYFASDPVISIINIHSSGYSVKVAERE